MRTGRDGNDCARAAGARVAEVLLQVLKRTLQGRGVGLLAQRAPIARSASVVCVQALLPTRQSMQLQKQNQIALLACQSQLPVEDCGDQRAGYLILQISRFKR
jgi:hypothetical protein